MAKIRVYQPKDEHLDQVKQVIDIEEQNPTEEILHTLYTSVLETEEMALPPAYTEEDILIDSMESMVNVSNSRVRNLGPYDVIEITDKGTRKQILLLADDEYEIISE